MEKNFFLFGIVRQNLSKFFLRWMKIEHSKIMHGLGGVDLKIRQGAYFEKTDFLANNQGLQSLAKTMFGMMMFGKPQSDK